MKPITLLLFLLSLIACGKGWSQGDRDKLIQSCVQKAQAAAPGMDPTKLKNYCSCFQQNIEKKFPSILDLSTAGPEAVNQEAQSCLPLMVQ